MKKMILTLAMILMAAPAFASSKPERFVTGRTSVTKTWVEKKGDSFDLKTEVVCQQAIQIPVYTGKAAPNSEDIKLLNCETTNRNEKPVSVVIFGMISQEAENKTISASYAPSEGQGSWSAYISHDGKLGKGTLFIPSPFPSADQDVFSLTSYSVSISFEDNQ